MTASSAETNSLRETGAVVIIEIEASVEVITAGMVEALSISLIRQQGKVTSLTFVK